MPPGASVATTSDVDFAGSRVWIAGHRGMVGSALVRRLTKEGATLLTVSRNELDLRRQAETERWIQDNQPDYIFIAAAKVGGILANASHPASFLYDNLMIETNVVEAARKVGVKKLMLLGSSCIYPRLAAQPMQESSLLTGPLEETNQWYAIAKIAGVKLVQAYRREHGLNAISVMPTNLYGPNDNYHPRDSHVAAALLRRIHQAKVDKAESVVIWGTGTPLREFLHVDDLADACIFLMRYWGEDDPLNIGSGQEVSVADLAALIAEIVGWAGRFEFDVSKPDGTPRKLLDASRLQAMGWTSSISLRDGLTDAYTDFYARWEGGEFNDNTLKP